MDRWSCHFPADWLFACPWQYFKHLKQVFPWRLFSRTNPGLTQTFDSYSTKHITLKQYLLNPTKANRKRRNRARNIANAKREKAMNSYYNDVLNIRKPTGYCTLIAVEADPDIYENCPCTFLERQWVPAFFRLHMVRERRNIL